VITAADAAADPTATEDSYLAKVVRYIPGEVVAAYLAAYNALKAAAPAASAAAQTPPPPGIPFEKVLWGVVVVLGVLTPFWILYATNDPAKPRPTFQAAAATFAFLVWVFAIPEGPFSSLSWYNPVYGLLGLILSTFLIPLAEKIFVKPS
jgi:hypothetical protein